MIKTWDWTINRPRYLISSVSLTSQHAPCLVCDSAHRRRHSQITDNVFEKRTMINNSWNVQQRTHYVTVTYTNHYHITSQYVRYFLPVDKKHSRGTYWTLVRCHVAATDWWRHVTWRHVVRVNKDAMHRLDDGRPSTTAAAAPASTYRRPSGLPHPGIDRSLSCVVTWHGCVDRHALRKSQL